MEQLKHTLSVIIPTYNGRALLERYLPAAIAACGNSRSVQQYEIIVADDASTDGTAEFLAERFPSVKTLTAATNGGFPTNVNRALRAAQYEWMLLLNNDMELLPDTLDTLFPLCDDNIFGVGCAICDPADGSVQEGRKRLVASGHRIHYSDDRTAGTPCPTMYLCGGLALINREKATLLGGLDETYAPFYFEDTDLSLRAWQHGWQCLYTPLARGLHQHSATIGTYPREEVAAIFRRNQLLFSYRFLPRARMVSFRCNLLFHALGEQLRHRQHRPCCEAHSIIRSGRMTRHPLTIETITKINNDEK